MGSNMARDMADSVALDEVKLDVALEYHLRGNHYPPLPLSLVPCCKEAINNANADKWYDSVKLPDGISWRGQDSAPTHECIKAWHLQWFLKDSEDKDE